MKRRFFVLLFLVLFLLSTQNVFSVKVTLSHVPASVDEFIKIRDSVATTPEGGAAIMVLALMVYANDHELGKQCLTIAITREYLDEGNVYKGFQPRKANMQLIESQMQKHPYLPKAYIKGATTENGYKIPDKNLVLEIFTTKYSGDKSTGMLKVFVEVYGYMARPVTLKVNDKGLWKAYEWSSLVVGVSPPKDNSKDDL